MHPVFIRLGPLEIHTYGVLVAIGFALGLATAARRARISEGLRAETIYDLGVWLIVAGLAGGKLFHIVFFWPDFLLSWQEMGWQALRVGFVFYGGLIGAALATIVYARRRNLPLAKLADACLPSVALGHAFGRLGCFFEGCCYGTACALPWAVRFPAHHPAHSYPVHPTQLYEAAGNLLLFAGLTLWYRQKRFDGQIAWLYVLGYGVIRFVVEFFRGDYAERWLGLFSASHLIAAIAAVAAVAVLLRRKLLSR
ncbi:prolipoprotein diacylglyceryl transferase [bacterium]|nr:prolipoprotein diacylglyceryl transferase [bacterium]